MKKLLVAVFLLLPLFSFAQEEAAAVILDYKQTFELKSVANGTYTVSAKILVNKESGNSEGRIVIVTDSDRSLGSFSATLASPSGTRKLKKSDLESRALARELADDVYLYYFQPNVQYPYIIEYEYSLYFKRGVSSFPTFIPVNDEDVKLVKGEYVIDVPAGFGIQYSSPLEPKTDKSGTRDVYTWKVENYEGYTEESYMPRIFSFVPYVYASPINFMYSKVEGKQGDWKEIGKWLYDLQRETWDLSSEDVERVRSLVKGCSTQYEKIKALYDYLRLNTRYESIQLGIGGYKPFNCSKVIRTGFGDCKALSNYMKAMLKVIGIESDYYIVHTDKPDLEKNYASVGQMNHAMLAVPITDEGVMKGDTIWMECTNPKIPLGYRHDDIAGHQVVLIKEDGGVLTRCGAYADSLSLMRNDVKIMVSSTGDAEVNVHQSAYLDFSESLISLPQKDPKDQSRFFAREIIVSSNEPKIIKMENNFNDYPKYGRAFVPCAKTDFSFECRNYAESNGERLFIPVTPLKYGFHVDRGTRKNPVHVSRSVSYVDSISIVVPPTYEIESLPKAVNADCGWAVFSSTIKAEGSVITVILSSKSRKGDYPKESYAAFRTAGRKFNNMCKAKIVLKRK